MVGIMVKIAYFELKPDPKLESMSLHFTVSDSVIYSCVINIYYLTIPVGQISRRGVADYFWFGVP